MDIIVETSTPTATLKAPSAGRIAAIRVKNGEDVRRGDTLLEYRQGDTTVFLTSPIAGAVSYPGRRSAGMENEKGAILLQVQGLPAKSSSVSCHGYATRETRSLIKKGREIRIPCKGDDGKNADFLTGSIANLSPMPNENGLFFFEIRLSPKDKERCGKGISGNKESRTGESSLAPLV